MNKQQTFTCSVFDADERGHAIPGQGWPHAQDLEVRARSARIAAAEVANLLPASGTADVVIHVWDRSGTLYTQLVSR